MYDEFEINKYHYVDKKTRLQMTIYARMQKTADEIIEIANQYSSFHFVPKRWWFVRKTITGIPPYELEQEQLRCAEEQLEYRKKHANQE